MFDCDCQRVVNGGRLQERAYDGEYKPLYEYLVKKSQEGHASWHTSFAEIERIIRAPLPPSA